MRAVVAILTIEVNIVLLLLIPFQLREVELFQTLNRQLELAVAKVIEKAIDLSILELLAGNDEL